MVIGAAAGLIAVAYTVAWFKSQPWRQQKVNGEKASKDRAASTSSQSGSSTMPLGVPARKID